LAKSATVRSISFPESAFGVNQPIGALVAVGATADGW